MIFSRNCRLKSKQAVLLLSCLGFLSMIFLPGASLALPVVTSNGSALISLNSTTLTELATLNWMDNSEAPPVDTRSSSVGTGVGLTWKQPVEEANNILGNFGTISSSASLSNLLGKAEAKAGTLVGTSSAQLSASANTSVNLFSKLVGAMAEVTNAQAVFAGQFTIARDPFLDLHIPVSLVQSLKSITPFGSAYSDIRADISVSYYDAYDVEQIVKSDTVFLKKTINGVKCVSSSITDSLDLVFNFTGFDPTIIYFFELSASVVGWADPPAETSVPEPASMLLLGAGLLGIGFFSRKLKKDR